MTPLVRTICSFCNLDWLPPNKKSLGLSTNDKTCYLSFLDLILFKHPIQITRRRCDFSGSLYIYTLYNGWKVSEYGKSDRTPKSKSSFYSYKQKSKWFEYKNIHSIEKYSWVFSFSWSFSITFLLLHLLLLCWLYQKLNLHGYWEAIMELHNSRFLVATVRAML